MGKLRQLGKSVTGWSLDDMGGFELLLSAACHVVAGRRCLGPFLVKVFSRVLSLHLRWIPEGGRERAACKPFWQRFSRAIWSVSPLKEALGLVSVLTLESMRASGSSSQVSAKLCRENFYHFCHRHHNSLVLPYIFLNVTEYSAVIN